MRWILVSNYTDKPVRWEYILLYKQTIMPMNQGTPVCRKTYYELHPHEFFSNTSQQGYF